MTHSKLLVWQLAVDLVEVVYRQTLTFPNDERFGLIAQLRLAAVSIPSNIAEGAARRSVAEFLNFLGIARGSLAELQTQLILSVRPGYLNTSNDAQELSVRVFQLLNALMAKLESRRSAP